MIRFTDYRKAKIISEAATQEQKTQNAATDSDVPKW